MRKGLLLLILTLALQMGISNTVFAEEDIQAPALTAFDISPKVVNTDEGDQIITVTFSAEDNLSGIGCASLEMELSDDVYEIEFDDFYNTVENEKSGTYSMQGVLPKGSIEGEWSVGFFVLEDQAGNYVIFSAENIEVQFGTISTRIKNILNDEDLEKPETDPKKNEENILSVEEIKISKPEFSFSGKLKDAIFSSKKKNYIKNNNVKFKGELEDAADGKVVINYKGADKGEEIVKVDKDGKWSEKVKFDKNGNYKVKFTFLDKDGKELGKKGYYQINIDTKDPKIENLPARVSKHIGDKVWWNVSDNEKIDEYKYCFNGKKVKTKDQFFHIPQGTSRGEYLLEIQAYDKAGNKDVKSMRVSVR